MLLTNFAFAQSPDTLKAPAQAKMPDVKKGVYVTDFTHTLTNDQVDNLNERAAAIYKKSGFELIIVLMDALPKDVNVNEATTAIDEKWSPGDSPGAERLIYVAGLKQHGHRIKGVRGAKSGVLFNRARCTSILTAMKPFYDKHDYNGGLQLMVDSVSAVLHVDTGTSVLDNSTAIYIGAIILGAYTDLIRLFQQ